MPLRPLARRASSPTTSARTRAARATVAAASRSIWRHAPRELVVIDTETTGLGRAARLVEIAALRVHDGDVVETFATLVDPRVPIPSAVTRIHGITDAMVCGAPDAHAALTCLARVARGAPLVAHNAPFDRGILAGEYARTGVAPPGLALYCTCKLARRVFPDAPNHRLETLAALFALRTPRHRALADAEAALGVLAACLEAGARPLDALHGPPSTV